MAVAQRVHVGADDRTGALEVAGMCAEATGEPSRVDTVATAAAGATSDGAASVIDLGTRHLAPSSAAAVASLAGERAAAGADAVAHKIDSTLRGNWAVELVARQRVRRRRVLVVAAFPALGRRCIDGVVTAHGVPVDGEIDARRGAGSSRPAEHLRAAGAPAVAEVRGGAALERWLDTPDREPFAVCDAASDEDLADIAERWAPHAREVLLAGTAASIAAGVGVWCTGAGAGAGAGAPSAPRAGPIARSRAPSGPALVVCGSVHPMARAQLASLRNSGAVDLAAGDLESDAAAAVASTTILCSPIPQSVPVSDAEARAVGNELARAALRSIATGRWRTVVLVGGDTAAAVIGDRAVIVRGTVATGMPWFIDERTSALVVTKAGGFGDDMTLVRVLDAAPAGGEV